jgi:O-antigen/teichoic acid export membrane protein
VAAGFQATVVTVAALGVKVRQNILANAIGRVWGSVINFAFVPLYIRFLGIEAYGLVGFFVSLLATLAVLDLGLSTTVTRELARQDVHVPAGRAAARVLLRTLEAIYWGTSVFIGLGIVMLAPWIARNWIHASAMPTDAVIAAVRLMGLVALFRWPVPLYTGAFSGLQLQVPLNLIVGIVATVQGLGSAIVLWRVSPTVPAFLAFQSVSACIQIVLLRVYIWRKLRMADHTPVFSRADLGRMWRFSAGVSGITMLSVVLTQFDKFLIGKTLPLETLGYYTLATSIAGVLNLGATAMYSALLPAFTALVRDARTDSLAALYHKGAQMLSLLVIPAGVAVAFFARELLALYVHDTMVVERTFRLLRYLVIGNIGLSVMLLPLALQFAHGWTSLSLYKNLVAVFLFVPAVVVLVAKHGAVGATIAWVGMTFGYLAIEVPLMHRRLLPGHQGKWYLMDVGVPLLISLSTFGALRLFWPDSLSPVATCVLLSIAGTASVILSVLSLPATRKWVADMWQSRLAVA